MINSLLSSEVQSFIDKHQYDDPNDILLKYKNIAGVSASLIADQIVGRRKIKEKIPSWYNHKGLIFPSSLSIEQSSSETTALHKARIIKNVFGLKRDTTLLDLTGGLGVDSFFFSQACKTIHFVEPNSELLQIVEHNFETLQATNISYNNSTAEDFLNNLSDQTHYDVVYIDPSRRTESGQKVFSLNQCTPDITILQSRIWQHTNHLLVKTSPLLDIKQGINELRYVKKILVTSVNNECKELLFHCEKNFNLEPTIEAINLGSKESSFSFSLSEEQTAEAKQSEPLRYLFEPNASILKSGAFKIICSRFNLYKLHPSTHLYTSESMNPEFPGRIFEIESFVKPDPRLLKNFFEEGRANIFTRNYPLSVSELRKKTKLKEGGDKFLIGCSGVNKKFLIVASRLNSE